jgi:hypothetical protein
LQWSVSQKSNCRGFGRCIGKVAIETNLFLILAAPRVLHLRRHLVMFQWIWSGRLNVSKIETLHRMSLPCIGANSADPRSPSPMAQHDQGSVDNARLGRILQDALCAIPNKVRRFHQIPSSSIRPMVCLLAVKLASSDGVPDLDNTYWDSDWDTRSRTGTTMLHK